MNKNALPRIAPFAVYMAFIALEQGLRFLAEKGVFAASPQAISGLYPLKAMSVALLLFFYRKSYDEISLSDLTKAIMTTVSIFTGLMVFVLWINMDFSFGTMGNPPGFNPNAFQAEGARICMIAVRLFGALLVVPVMEELFWRSFLMRYIISPDFTTVPIGRFTWSSLVITTLLFGLEHHLFLAGIMAGIAYNILLYKYRSIAQCIFAHAVTNLALGIYVLHSGKWYFW